MEPCCDSPSLERGYVVFHPFWKREEECACFNHFFPMDYCLCCGAGIQAFSSLKLPLFWLCLLLFGWDGSVCSGQEKS